MKCVQAKEHGYVEAPIKFPNPTKKQRLEHHVEYLESYFSCIKECNLNKQCCHNIKIYRVGQDYSRENDLAYFGENMYNNEYAILNMHDTTGIRVG